MDFGSELYFYYIQDDTGAARVITQTPLSEFVSGNEVVFDGFFYDGSSRTSRWLLVRVKFQTFKF